MRVLVVEDDPRLGPSLKKWLEAHHYAVDNASNSASSPCVTKSTA